MMLLNQRVVFALTCAVLLLPACEGTLAPHTDDGATMKILRLDAGDDGSFESCDAAGNCQSLPNPDQCAALEVTINEMTGATCEVCYDASGAVRSSFGQMCGDCAELTATGMNSAGTENCHANRVECAVFTAPEPDCVVCAYVGGSVVYSSCTVAAPHNCSVSFDPATGQECSVCYDEAGRGISNGCATTATCADTICPALACAPGYVPFVGPNDCCPTCVAERHCDADYCTQDRLLPACPPSTVLVRDPADCCAYYCEPVGCPPMPSGSSGGVPASAVCQADSDCGPGLSCNNGLCVWVCDANAGCPDGSPCVNGVCSAPPSTDPACPAGYAMSFDYPYCGTCLPVDNSLYCQADADCASGEVCTAGSECLQDPNCACSANCDPASGVCSESCAPCAVCSGVCRPVDYVCPMLAPPANDFCGGRWQSPGRDAYGCPLPPVCACADGSISLDGLCLDSCRDTVCTMQAIECPAGEHLEQGYPYCCGVCVPDAQCWTSNASDPCALVDCGPGSICEVGALCAAVCAPAPISCNSSADCASDSFCSTEIGDCRPDSNMMAVCAGECLPGPAPTRPEPTCSSTLDCGTGALCSTEYGDCLAPSSCADPTMTCAAVCWGYCVDAAGINLPQPTFFLDQGYCFERAAACNVDSDCGSAMVCDAATGRCSESPRTCLCSTDADCPAAALCLTNEAVCGLCMPALPPCDASGACAAGQLCVAGLCEQSCPGINAP